MLSPKPELRIGNQWLVGEGSVLESVGPVDEQVVWATNEASSVQVDQAFTAARAAFGPWWDCLLYTSPSPRDRQKSRMPSSA